MVSTVYGIVMVSNSNRFFDQTGSDIFQVSLQLITPYKADNKALKTLHHSSFGSRSHWCCE
jgi:hypothetical protein